MILLLIGPPGSGKGTQANLLAEALELPHLVMGELLRREVHQNSDLGKRARSYMRAGELVPDELIAQLVKGWIERHRDADGFILDGFPRNQYQALLLDEILHAFAISVDRVIHLEVSDEEVVRRLSERRVCRECDAVYHKLYSPPHTNGACDRCGGPLEQREDDREDVILKRLAVYRKETEPLLRFYTDGRLSSLDGEGTIQAVFDKIHALVRNDHTEVCQ